MTSRTAAGCDDIIWQAARAMQRYVASVEAQHRLLARRAIDYTLGLTRFKARYGLGNEYEVGCAQDWRETNGRKLLTAEASR